MYQVIESTGVNYSNTRHLSVFNTEAEAEAEATRLHNIAAGNIDQANLASPGSDFFNDKMYSVEEVKL